MPLNKIFLKTNFSTRKFTKFSLKVTWNCTFPPEISMNSIIYRNFCLKKFQLTFNIKLVQNREAFNSWTACLNQFEGSRLKSRARKLRKLPTSCTLNWNWSAVKGFNQLAIINRLQKIIFFCNSLRLCLFVFKLSSSEQSNSVDKRKSFAAPESRLDELCAGVNKFA